MFSLFFAASHLIMGIAICFDQGPRQSFHGWRVKRVDFQRSLAAGWQHCSGSQPGQLPLGQLARGVQRLCRRLAPASPAPAIAQTAAGSPPGAAPGDCSSSVPRASKLADFVRKSRQPAWPPGAAPVRCMQQRAVIGLQRRRYSSRQMPTWTAAAPASAHPGCGRTAPAPPARAGCVARRSDECAPPPPDPAAASSACSAGQPSRRGARIDAPRAAAASAAGSSAMPWNSARKYSIVPPTSSGTRPAP